MPDLDDVSTCPVADACARCLSTDGLTVVTGQTAVGIFCCTLCDVCDQGRRLPVMNWTRAVAWSLEHCVHLGIDADQMAALMAAEPNQSAPTRNPP
jgi:hypothetical protein